MILTDLIWSLFYLYQCFVITIKVIKKTNNNSIFVPIIIFINWHPQSVSHNSCWNHHHHQAKLCNVIERDFTLVKVVTAVAAYCAETLLCHNIGMLLDGESYVYVNLPQNRYIITWRKTFPDVSCALLIRTTKPYHYAVVYSLLRPILSNAALCPAPY